MRRPQSRKQLLSLQLILLLFLLFFCFVSRLYAMDITLRWAPNTEPNLAGYKIFYREASRSYNYSVPYWETTVPECIIYDLDESKIYYFVVRAYDNNGNTSNNSNEVMLKFGTAYNNLGNDSGGGSGGGSGCFIATADYGSLLESSVNLLVQFRNRLLLPNGPGKIFVKFYDKYSPPATHFISKHAVLRALVCVFLLPLLGFSWILLNVGPGSTLLFTLMMGIGSVCFVKWKNTRLR